MIDNDNIERVFSTKFLGVIIDARLTWKGHVSKINAKLSEWIFFIKVVGYLI